MTHVRLALLSLPLLLAPRSSAEEAIPSPPVGPEVARLYNLVANGGFEDGETLPRYWHRHPAKDAQGYRLARDATVARSGRASGLLFGAPLEPGRTPPNLQWNRYGISVEGGSALILSCHVKTDGASPYRVGCHFYDEEGGHLGFTGVPFADCPAEWVYLREQVEVPSEARKMGFVLYAAGSGATWYDDVAVLGTPNVAAVRGRPVIDGKLDDACWASGGAITHFVLDAGTALSAVPTRAWIVYDDQALVVAFHCPHPKDARLRAGAKDHDQAVCRDDSVEILLDPDHDHQDYFHVCVNSLGHVSDGRGENRRWESKATAAARREEDAWTVEIRIPYDRLDIHLHTGTSWGVNLVRNDRVREQTTTWSLGGVRDARRFGNMFLEPDLWQFRRPALAREVAQREQEIEELRSAMRDVGMSEQAMAVPSRLLDGAEYDIEQLQRRLDTLTSDDASILTELQQSLTSLAGTVPEARRAATQFMFTANGADDAGFHVGIAHSLQKVPRSGPWDGGLFTKCVRLEAAQDETESFQLVVTPNGSPLREVAVDPAVLHGPGNSIAVEWHRVDYVETVPPKYPTSYVGWWPDPLLPPGPFDVAVKQRQPLWFRITVPSDAAPGMYSGQVTLRHTGQSVAVPIELRVRNFRLPRPGTLATAFGNYAWVLAHGYHGKGDYRKTLAIDDYAHWCEFMGRYRLGAKNSGREHTSVTHDGDTWHADLSALQLTLGTVGPKYYAPYSVGLHRLPSAPQFDRPGYQPDPKAWAAQTRAIATEWKRLGLPPEVFVYGVDEPRQEQYPLLREAYRHLRQSVPEHPIMQTVNHEDPIELAGVVDIWCPLTSRLESDFYAKRVQAGDTLWAYVCCSPIAPYANFFIDRPATEHRVLFWQARKAGATGILYWCVCWWAGLPTPGAGEPCWPEVPLRMHDHGASGPRNINGDGLLIYPGPEQTPYPSIRLEVIRDGIEDYEYLALLSRLVERAKRLPSANQPNAEVLTRAEALCRVPDTIARSMKEYTRDPNDIFSRRQQIARGIEQLIAITPP